MKKFRDKRKFYDVVRSIERMEKDVDAVLKAARLERVSGTLYVRDRMNSDDLSTVIIYLGLFVFIFGIMWLTTK